MVAVKIYRPEFPGDRSWKTPRVATQSHLSLAVLIHFLLFRVFPALCAVN